MEEIRILGHHAGLYFSVFYLKVSPEKSTSWKKDDLMERKGSELIRRVVNDPAQKVRITRDLDDICEFCPRNINGQNYQPRPGPYPECNPLQENFMVDYFVAEYLGLNGVIGVGTITSFEFFKLMEPRYKRLISENPDCSNEELLRVLSTEIRICVVSSEI